MPDILSKNSRKIPPNSLGFPSLRLYLQAFFLWLFNGINIFPSLPLASSMKSVHFLITWEAKKITFLLHFGSLTFYSTVFLFFFFFFFSFFFFFFSTSIISSQDLIMADEASSPLFLHYGKCLGAILVSQPLVSENYKVKGSLFLFWIIFFNPLNTLASRAQNPSHGRMNVKLGVELLNLKFLSCTWIITRTQKTRWVMWSLVVFNLDYDLTRYKSATIFNGDFFRFSP